MGYAFPPACRRLALIRIKTGHGANVSACYLEMKVGAGENVKDACADACRVAKLLGVTVWITFNGVQICCRPQDDPLTCAGSFEVSFARGVKYA